MLQNTILFIILTIICYLALLFVEKKFGAEGFFAWIAIATIISNILAASIGPMLGLNGVTLANVPFATVFISTQALSMCYGEEYGKKGVNIGLFVSIIFIVIMMISSYLIAEPYDSVTGNIKAIFGFGSYNMCNTIASVLMYYLANLFNVKIFNNLKKSKTVVFASIIASGLCNCIENFAFVLLGMYILPRLVLAIIPTAFGVDMLITINEALVIGFTTCVFEILLSLLNGPIISLIRSTHEKKNS